MDRESRSPWIRFGNWILVRFRVWDISSDNFSCACSTIKYNRFDLGLTMNGPYGVKSKGLGE